MAKPQSRPVSDNRARMVTTGDIPAYVPFDPASLSSTAVDGTPPAFALEGNLDLDNPNGENPGEQPPNPEPAQAEPTPAATQTATPAESTPADDILDPRFKGKSVKDVYESYRNLERLKGEKDAEVQNYKQLYETHVLKPQMEALKAKQVEPPSDDPASELNEMLSNPAAYRKRVVEQAKQELFQNLTQAAVQSEAQQEWHKHAQVFASPEFAAWEKQNLNPALIQAATTDAKIMRFIADSYRNATGAKTAPEPEPNHQPQPDRRIPIGPAIGAPSASRPAKTTPSFTTAQLARMQIENPEEYQRRQPEILAWYMERENKR